uniref:DUF4242 domain-containing protein n=1 Tax=Ascaris lumbricoides TaxID=6252 RepID=A0A0M3HI77_ASCLU
MAMWIKRYSLSGLSSVLVACRDSDACCIEIFKVKDRQPIVFVASGTATLESY